MADSSSPTPCDRGSVIDECAAEVTRLSDEGEDMPLTLVADAIIDLKELGASARHRIEVEEVLGAAFTDALQEDFDGIRELVRAVKITFVDGSPRVTIQALRDAYSVMAKAHGVHVGSPSTSNE